MVKLHKMTWRKTLEWYGKPVLWDEKTDLDHVIPETYWAEINGDKYELSKGAIGWNITLNGEGGYYCETLKEFRNQF